MIGKVSFLFAFLIIFSANLTFAQKTSPTSRVSASSRAESDKEAFEKAQAETDLAKKIEALRKFLQKFPKSEYTARAAESLVVTRARLADEKLRAGEAENAVALFKQAVSESPANVSDKLFSEVILQFPTNLFYGRQYAGAVEVAKAVEEKFSSDERELLGIATFYLATENPAEAKRIAGKVISSNGKSVAAYQTLGMAERINFDLEASETAYANALEADQNSAVSKRSLAEVQRALGKTDDAAALYREMLAQNPDDAAAATGLVLTLFDGGKQTEAEAEAAKLLEAIPNNLPLLTGAAYRYAAIGQGDKAVEYAQKALAAEPRYTWAYIALARGYAAQNNPLEAEKTLLAARQFGNFPTLDYEIANARIAAGYFREAATELKKSFSINNGEIETKLGNRVSKKAPDFAKLLDAERRASIFAPFSAITAEESERAKNLLILNQKADEENISENDLNQAVNEFVKGGDKMKTFRLMYAADLLLSRRKNLPKVLELTQAAIAGVDDSLTVASPVSSVLADELLPARTAAISAGQVIVMPEVPRQTLSAILRGRIEDNFARVFYEQGKTEEAVLRFKRAVSILPEKSSFWRASMWRLGIAYDASGNTKEALDAYLKTYSDTQPDPIRRAAIEAAYRKVNGNIEGLDKLIGAPPEGYVSVQTAAEIPQTAPQESVKPIETAPAETKETKTETAAPEIAATPKEVLPEPKGQTESKPLFAPVIIQIPNSSKSAAETKAEPPTCLVVSQESASIIRNGGNLGFLVGFNEKNNPDSITGESSSPDDVSVTLDKSVGSLSNRAFFVIKSVSEKTGEFQITFKSPCGNKQIKVTVR